MKSFYVGVDISKKKVDVALLLNDKCLHKVFDNKLQGFQAFLAWIMKHVPIDSLHVCLEATGIYGEALATFLHENKILVSVVNPAQIKAFGRSQNKRVKTDKIDAVLIAHFCKQNQPKAWQPPSPDLLKLRDLEGQYSFLKETYQRQKNRLEMNLSDDVKNHILETLKFIAQQIDTLKSKMMELIRQNEILSKQANLLDTIPAIGEETIINILASVEVTKFENAKQLAAYTGITPAVKTSGTSLRGRGGISRIGDKKMRTALYMPAMVAIKHNPLVKEFSERLAQKGKAKKLIICAAIRKLLHIIFGVLKNETPFVSAKVA